MEEKNIDGKDETTSSTYEGFICLEHTFYDRFAGMDVNINHHFKKPNRHQVARVQKGFQKDNLKAYGTLLAELVHPDERDVLKKNIKEYPGICNAFGNAILTSVGVGDLGN